MNQQQNKRQTLFPNPNNKITLLLSLYCVLVIWLLHCEFHSAEQSYDISQLRLYDNKISPPDHSQQRANHSKNIILLLIDSAKYSYWSQIPIIKQLVQSSPQNSILAKTLVSQPTMTTQKIQTLMTGSQIFSSTSIMDAFFSSSVNVDNIITQINAQGGKTVSLGDETWGRLFRFAVEYPCVTTFDIWDWQTCDKIISTHFIDQVRNKNQITVGHFLALDHIGHASSSITHPEFKAKKQQISQFIQRIIQKMDDHILMVTGDHGMRDDGNHGGGSIEESQSFLFAYTKTDQLVPLSKQEANVTVRQPDITATLSILAGVPVPTNSIGIPIFIPSSYLSYDASSSSQQNSMQILRGIYSNLQNHFKNLLQLNRIPCPPLAKTPQQEAQWNTAWYLHAKLKEIQQKCLVHISHSQPNIPQIILILTLLIIVCCTLSLCLRASIPQYLLVLALALPHSFSWLVIRNSSTYYLICLMVVICVCGRAGILNRVVSIALVAILSQLQPLKQGEYMANQARVQWIGWIVNRPQVYTVVCVVWACYSMYRCIHRYNNYHTNANTNTNNNTNTNTHININRKHSPNTVAKLLKHSELLVIVLISISYILKQVQMVQYQSIVNILASVVVVLAVVVCLSGNIVMKYRNSNGDSSMRIVQIVRLYLIMFGGYCAIPIYILTTALIHNHGSSHARTGRCYPYFCYLVSHYVWWVLGNRYEYSSIDIRQSYIFSTTYHSYLNPTCLCVHMMAPYLLVLLSMLKYQHHIRDNNQTQTQVQLGSNQFERVPQQPEPQQAQETNNQNQSGIKQSKQDTRQDKQVQQHAQRQIQSQSKLLSSVTPNSMYPTLCKYSLFAMAWLICCFINLTYNHQKILYTVVYVPMTVIEVAKIILIVTTITLYGACTCRSSIKLQ